MPTTYLLDKGIIKRLSEARIRVFNNRLLTPEQALVVALVQALQRSASITYISTEIVNIVQRRDRRLAQILSSWTRPLQKGRYLRRWVRRLRSYGFAREDATLISTGSFGLDTQKRTFGAEMILTLDRRMITNYKRHLVDIQTQFETMTRSLPIPYNRALLPDLATPTIVLQFLRVITL